jgi:hypothetical protein
MMAGKKMIAIAKEDYEFSSTQKWKKGKRYNMVYDEIGGIIALDCDSGYVDHWSTDAFKEISENFEFEL